MNKTKKTKYARLDLRVTQSELYSKGKKKEYWMHRQGKQTHRDMLREDVEYCLSYASNAEEFEKQLSARGYTLDRVRLSVKAKGWERSVRLSNIGYTREQLNARLAENREKPYFHICEWNAHLPYRPKQFPLEAELRRLQFSVEHSYDTATVLVDTLFLILIELFGIVTQLPDVLLLSPDLRNAAKEIERYRADYHFLNGNGIHTVQQLEEHISDTQSRIAMLEAERAKADNVRRRAHTPEERQAAKNERKEITEKLRPLREQLKQAEKIREESPHLYELLQQEHGLEKAAIQKTERYR